jgi:hypothetical protein
LFLNTNCFKSAGGSCPPIILATQEAEIRKIKFQSQPGQIVHKTLSRKHPTQKRAGGVAQGVGPEFKPQYHKQTKKEAAEDMGYEGNKELSTSAETTSVSTGDFSVLLSHHFCSLQFRGE